MRDGELEAACSAVIAFDDRESDSPLIERVWRCHSERPGRFLSMASPHWEMAVTRLRGRVTLTLRGPETRPTWADCPADGEWLGIRFRLGTFMPAFPVSALMDRNDVNLRSLSAKAFVLGGRCWAFPEFENAEAFVASLSAEGLIGRDRVVEAALQGERSPRHHRTMQRRMLRTVGMAKATLRQIERARHAAFRLRAGVPIAEVAHELGYFDQAHLTRSVARLIGQTPASIMRGKAQLSFLYNTARSHNP